MIPTNEMEVIVLFSQQAEKAGFEILKVQVQFPDAIIQRNDVQYRVEFEFYSSNFNMHGHSVLNCDMVICWLHDDSELPLYVLELSKPNWKEDQILLPSDSTKEIYYWKNRALKAERKLGIEFSPNKLKRDYGKQLTQEDELKVVELANSGRSITSLTKEFFGKKAGGFQAERIKKIIHKHRM